MTYDSTLPVLTRQDGDYAVTHTATTTDDAKYTAANAISAAAKALDFEAAAELRDQLILVKGQLGQKLVPKKKKSKN